MGVSFTFPSDATGTGAIRIQGFGACMIGGTPYKLEDSFLWKACQAYHAKTGCGLDVGVTSLGGFPTYKAAEHVQRALRQQPSVLIIQFGSTDLTISLRSEFARRKGQKKSASLSKSSSLSSSTTDPDKAFRRNLARTVVDSCKLMLCRLLKVRPIHGDESVYLPAIEKMIDAALAAGAHPVILAPFPHGDPVSDLWASRYCHLLQQLARSKSVGFVDTYHGLQAIPLEQLVLSDKLHLTRLGHTKVGELISKALESLITEKQIVGRPWSGREPTSAS